MTLSEIIDDLQSQLDWRGPGGQPQGQIVIPRSEADELITEIEQLKQLIKKLDQAGWDTLKMAARECDQLRTDKDRLKAALEPFALHVEVASLAGALGHITRTHLLDARAALAMTGPAEIKGSTRP